MELHGKLEPSLKKSWPLDTIPDAILLAVFLNPACASHNMLDCVETSVKTSDEKTLCGKVKKLAVQELTLFMVEEREEAEWQ